MTARGWSALALAGVLWLWSRLLGIGEILQVALALGVLLLAAAIWLRFRSRNLLVTRAVPESRIHRGDTVTMNVTIRNRDTHATPSITVFEKFPGSTESYELEVPPLPFGEHRLPVTVLMNRRGRYLLDGLQAILTDPFHLVRNRRKFADPATFIVYPRIETLPAPERKLSSSGGDNYRRAPASQGEDFYGVRDFRDGDDPRKIHWPTSARLGVLMVREEEVSARDRITLLLDDRSNAHSTESFDWAADAAASVADLYFRMELRVRLVRPGGTEIAAGRGSAHFERIMEDLAVATLAPANEDRLLALARRSQEDVLVIVSGEMGAATVAAAGRIAGRYREMVVVFPPGAQSAHRYAEPLRRTGVRVVAPHPAETLIDAWEASMGRGG